MRVHSDLGEPVEHAQRARLAAEQLGEVRLAKPRREAIADLDADLLGKTVARRSAWRDRPRRSRPCRSAGRAGRCGRVSELYAVANVRSFCAWLLRNRRGGSAMLCGHASIYRRGKLELSS